MIFKDLVRSRDFVSTALKHLINRYIHWIHPGEVCAKGQIGPEVAVSVQKSIIKVTDSIHVPEAVSKFSKWPSHFRHFSYAYPHIKNTGSPQRLKSFSKVMVFLHSRILKMGTQLLCLELVSYLSGNVYCFFSLLVFLLIFLLVCISSFYVFFFWISQK